MLLYYISLFFLFYVHSQEIKPVKLCINCKHFVLKPSFSNPENGKCLLFQKMNTDKKNLVTGYNDILDYEKCIIVRNNENMCGEDGKYYEPGNKDNYELNEFLRKLFKKYRINDNIDFLKCPN